MKSIQNQYIDLKEGKMSQANFMRNLRMTLPQYITNVTSFNDAVKILKNKSILTENNIKEVFFPKKGQSYTWTMGAELMPIKYIGKRSENPDIKVGSSVGKGFIFQFEHGGYIELGPQTIHQYIEPNNTDLYPGNMGDEMSAPTSISEAKKTLWWIMIKKEGKRYYLKNAPYFFSPEEANKYADQHKIKNYTLKSREEEVDDDGRIISEAKKSKLTADQVNPSELRMGIRVEMEHTDDPKKAEKIALDHLAENPFYYTQLKLSGVDVKATPSKEKKAIAKKKDETELVDKANQMKIPKGVEKIKASANKAKKETNKPVKGVQELTHASKKAKGVKQIMSPTGGKMKVVKENLYGSDNSREVSEDEWINIIKKDPVIKDWAKQGKIEAAKDVVKNSYILTWDNSDNEIKDYLLSILHMDLGENENALAQQGRELSKQIANLGLNKEKWDALSPNEKLNAVDKNRFIPKSMRLQAAKMSWEELRKNFDGVLQGFAFPTEPKKQGTDLGSSFDKLKNQIKEIVRKIIKQETFDGRDNLTNIEENENFSSSDIQQMRDWLKDLTFENIDDMDEFVDSLSDKEVIKAVDRHWDGGLEDFKNIL